MNKNIVLKQIEERLSVTVKNVENGDFSEHDIFPSLLWLLLENSKDLENFSEITKNTVLERISNLKQVSATEVENIVNKLLLEQISNLKLISIDDVKIITIQENQKTLSTLLESNGIIEKSIISIKNVLTDRIDNLKPIDADIIKTMITQENQKTLSLLKWIFGFCILQFIGLAILVAIIFTR